MEPQERKKALCMIAECLFPKDMAIFKTVRGQKKGTDHPNMTCAFIFLMLHASPKVYPRKGQATIGLVWVL